MADTLYDKDILLWSERQAEIIRALGQTRRDLPNDFDAENVAEEVESVGRSELASVESHLEVLLAHVVKLYAEPASPDAKRWRGEVLTFGNNARKRSSPSMAQRIDLEDVWSAVLERARLEFGGDPSILDLLPAGCPFELRELIGKRIDGLELASRLQRSAGSKEP